MHLFTLVDSFHKTCKDIPDKIAYRYKEENKWHAITWQQQFEACRKISKSLIALGVSKGAKINILAQTSLEWVQCDLGILACGAVSVGVYPSSLAADCRYIIDHCGAEIIFVDQQEQVEKILEVRNDLPALKHIILMNMDAPATTDALAWQDFLEMGAEVSDGILEERKKNIHPDDMAFIVYTSGTTGQPKGVMLSHHATLFTYIAAMNSCHLLNHYETLLFLPLAHVYARGFIYLCIVKGITTAFVENVNTVGDNLKEIKPHFFVSVPRVFEKIQEKIITEVQAGSPLKKKVFNLGLKLGLQKSKLLQQKETVPNLLLFKCAFFDLFVFSKIQNALGGRLAWTVAGGAPSDKNMLEFFHACGILILEGIGMTENCSFSNVNRFDNYKFGTVGSPGPGIEVKISNNGEVLTRGENTMMGYYKDSIATGEAIDNEGWLHTGDIGEIDEDGFLKITDRKKNIIVTSGGKNIAPLKIEQALLNSPFVSQALAYGDRKKYITALVTLNAEAVNYWCHYTGASQKKLEDLCSDSGAIQLIADEVAKANKGLASFESIKQFRILPYQFSIENGFLTPTLKLKRKVVIEKNRAVLEKMYQ